MQKKLSPIPPSKIRKSGILLPISSLPSPHGIGSLGKNAYEFIDFLEQAGQKIWQVLPIPSTSARQFYSPYKSNSVFSFNFDLIDLNILAEQGLLKETVSFDFGQDPRYIDYPKVRNGKLHYLRSAFCNRHLLSKTKQDEFEQNNNFWLNDFAYYMASTNGGEEDFSKNPLPIHLEEEINFYKFTQFLFFEQWIALKNYANKKGISLFGDIPIYVSENSADFCLQKELFQTTPEGNLSKIAGVPPDGFSDEGQLWGNPLYDWTAMKENHYTWWINRIRHALALYDILRIDHFRAFAEYYSIDPKEASAKNGVWKQGPSMDFFHTLQNEIPNAQIVAEDLGISSNSVQQLLKETGYPGMKILLFAFDGNPDNTHLPHNHTKNSVVYTGTHDNKTAKEWLESEPEHCINHAVQYLHLNGYDRYTEGFIRSALSSIADTCIIPMQDWLDYGSFARMNVPSTTNYNWTFRLLLGEYNRDLANHINTLTKLYGR